MPPTKKYGDKAHWSSLLLPAARNSTPYSRALREQQQCTKQRSIVPTDTWGAISSSSKSRAIAFFGRVYRLSANLFHQQVRMFLFGKSPVSPGGFIPPSKPAEFSAGLRHRC